MKNNFISVKDFEDACTIFSKIEPAEIFMGRGTENIIDTLFKQWKHQIKKEADLPMIVWGYLNYYFQRIDIRRGGSYITSPDWIANKKATINPKNEKDDECFKWALIAGLNYNKIK